MGDGYDAGKFINLRTARSQARGRLIWGTGRPCWSNRRWIRTWGVPRSNFSGYLLPTNADIPDLDAIFSGGFDGEAGPVDTKGVSEVVAVSVAPAIVNAVYHVTGKRVRKLAVTIEKL